MSFWVELLFRGLVWFLWSSLGAAVLSCPRPTERCPHCHSGGQPSRHWDCWVWYYQLCSTLRKQSRQWDSWLILDVSFSSAPYLESLPDSRRLNWHWTPFLSHSQHKILFVGEMRGRGRARKILTLFVLVLKFIHGIQSARLNHSSFEFCLFETSALSQYRVVK